jgi:prepilin-type N-terminal cleavage/methylation domain-containing protein
MRRKTAFTLVELLVVIGIISILIAMLLPALNKARQMATQTACLSNLKQIGNAVSMYESENRGYIPFGFVVGSAYFSGYGGPENPKWFIRLAPYFNYPVRPDAAHSFYQFAPGTTAAEGKSIFACPANMDDTDYKISYGPNLYAAFPPGESSSSPVGTNCNGRISQVKQSQEKVFLIETDSNYSTVTNPRTISPSYPEVVRSFARHNGANLNNSGGSMLFFDGHAQFLRYAEVEFVGSSSSPFRRMFDTYNRYSNDLQ